MKILIACEFSGRVRDAFLRLGHDAWSCDLLDSESPGPHITRDVASPLLLDNWDLVIAHPPCTYLCVSGARWWAKRRKQQEHAINFFMMFAWATNPDGSTRRTAIENPIGIMSKAYRPPDQIIQPWQYGHGAVKATCLWLNGLPKLTPTKVVDGREARIHMASPSATRWMERSRTYKGIALAMAQQWGNL